MSDISANSKSDHQQSAALPTEDRKQHEYIGSGNRDSESSESSALSLEGETPLASRSVALEDSGVVAKAQNAIDEAAAESHILYSVDQISPEGLDSFNGENPYVSPVRTTDQLEDLKTVGEILRYHRQRVGLSLNEVANKLRVRPATISDIENNKLNDLTYSSFASNVIARYAIVLHLDHKSLVELYESTLDKGIAIEHEKRDAQKIRQRRNRNLARLCVFGILVLAVGGGLWSFMGRDSELSSGEIGELKASVHGSQNLEQLDPNVPLTINDPEVSGTLVLEGSKQQPAVIVEAESNQNAPEVQVVDLNTARATQQAQVLQAEADAARLAQLQEQQGQNTASSTLSLPQDAVPTHDGNDLLGANVDQGPALVDSPVTTAPNAVADTAPEAALSIEEQARLAAERVKAAQQGNAPVISSNEPTADAAVEAKSQQDAAAAADAAATNEATAANDAAETETPAPELNAKLKNVSSSVKIVNRDALGSLNRVSIEVTGPVAIKVMDSNKKVLASGSYKSGDRVSATGIPPLTVQVSDTQAVRISYSGGKLEMPKDQQVQFELPMR